MTGSGVHDVLVRAAVAAEGAYREALRVHSLEALASEVGIGGDGTPTSYLDQLVDEAVLEAVRPTGVNVLSEEIGWVDRGSAMTLVVDPLDGTANAVAGVPICAFAGALAVESTFVEGLVSWFDVGRVWHARADDPVGVHGRRVTGRRDLDGASVSLLRPKPETAAAWSRVAGRAGRVRVLGSSVIEACLVADGAIDAFADCGGEVHRLVDLAAVSVLISRAGGVLRDCAGRPIEFDTDLLRRWSGVAAATSDLADELITTIRS